MKNARFSHRLLAMLLAFLMVLTSVPVVAFADEGASGVQNGENAGTTTPSGSENGENTRPTEPGTASELQTLVDKGGVVKLENDYVIDKTIAITESVEIDLNGHTVTYTATGAQGGFYVFEVGVWADGDVEGVAPDVVIRDSSDNGTGAVISQYTDVLCLVHGTLTIESGYYKAAAANKAVLRLNALFTEEDNDRLTVYNGRFDGGLPQTYDGHFVVYGGLFNNPNIANLLNYDGSIFKIVESVAIDEVSYYVVAVGVTEADRDEICEWYLAGGRECQACVDGALHDYFDLVIHDAEEYVWFARLVSEGAFEYNGKTIDAADDSVILAEDITFDADDLYVPIGSKRAPFVGVVEGRRDHKEGGLAISVTVPAIDAIHAGVFGYLADGACVFGVNAKVGEVKNVANIMGEHAAGQLNTSAGAMAGTVEGTVNFRVGAVSANVPLVGVVAGEANFRGPVHQIDGEGNDVAPTDGYIDTKGLYTAKTGTVAIKGGFFAFELALEDVAEGLVRTRESIDVAKVNNSDNAYWYSVTDIGKFVAYLNNTDLGDYGYFESLQAAIDASDKDHTGVTVLKDIAEESVSVGADKLIVLNFGRYGMEGELVVAGTAEIYGVWGTVGKVIVKGTAVIDGDDMIFNDVQVAEKATLTVKNGIVNKLNKGAAASITIEGGYFKALNEDKQGYVIRGGFFTDAAKPNAYMADGKNGYAVVVNTGANAADYPWTIANEGNEARVECDGMVLVFQYVEEALDFIYNNSRQNAVVTLLSDATLDAAYKNSVKLAYTLDLGGYTLSAKQDALVITAGDVTIKNGTLSAEGTAIWVDNTGIGTEVALTLADDLKVVSNGTALLVQAGEGAVTVNTEADLKGAKAAIAVRDGFKPAKTQVNVMGGLIEATDVAIYLDDVATVNVTGGSIVEAGVAFEVCGGTLVIGGNSVVVSGADACIYVHYVDDTHAPIDVTVNGGYYDAEEYSVVVKGSADTVKMAINGGVYHAPVISNGVYAFVSGGYFAEIARNLVVTTKARSDVADYEIGGKMYYRIVDSVEAYLYDATIDAFVGYQYLEWAINDAAHGATVYVAKDLSDKDAEGNLVVVPDPADPSKTITRVVDTTAEAHVSYSIQLDRCVTITSFDPDNTGVQFTLENISFDLHTYIDEYPAGHEASDVATHYTFKSLKFRGNAHIHYHKQQGVSTLTVEKCDANVTDGAFLYAWDAMGVVAGDYELMLTVVMKDNVILAKDENNQYNYAVEIEATLADGSELIGNVFGSLEQPYSETFVFKALKVVTAERNGGERAIIVVANNTVYMNNGNRPAAAFDFAGDSVYLVKGYNNDIITSNTVAEGQLPARIAMYAVGSNGTIIDFKNGDNESTIDGAPLTLQNVFYQPGQLSKYVGIRVELGHEDRYDAALGEIVNATVIVGGIFDFVDEEIQKSLSRTRYFKLTQFKNGYKNMTDYEGYVVTAIAGSGTLADPYIIPDDVAMTQILLLGAKDGAYYLVGEGVSDDLVAAFVADLNDGYDPYTNESNLPASVAYVQFFTVSVEGVAEEVYVKYGYKNLAEAFADANNRTIVLIANIAGDTLTADATATEVAVNNITATLDLNGYTVALHIPVAINGGIVTLKNSAVNAASVSATGTAFTVANGGLIVEAGVKVASDTATDALIVLNDNGAITVRGELSADNAAIISATGANTAITVEEGAIVDAATSNVAIEQVSGTTMIIGGKVSGQIIIHGGNFILMGGEIYADEDTIQLDPTDADTVINAMIMGGIIDCALGNVCLATFNSVNATVNLSATGGTFGGKVETILNGWIQDYDVYFGDYNYDPDFEAAYGDVRDNTYIPAPRYFGVTADGVQLACTTEAELGADGYYYWSAEAAEAKVDSEGAATRFYASVYEALNYIYFYGADDVTYTVTLITDAEMDMYANVDKNVVLDLAGKTLTLVDEDISVIVTGNLTVKNGIVAGADTMAAIGGEMTLEAVIFNADILVMPDAQATDGTNAVLNVADENVTVNGDVIVAWNVEYLGNLFNTTGKAVLNISAGTFNGTIRLRAADEVVNAQGLISENGFVGNITGGLFAFPEDDTFKPNNMLCAQGKAFAAGEVALPETIVTDSGRTTYYEVVDAVAEAEFYTIMNNDDKATVWVGFATVEEALEAMSNTGNARLVADYTLDVLVELNVVDEVVFDLNGKVLTLGEEGYISITGAYALTVKNGTVAAGAEGWNPMFKLTAGATLMTTDVTITSEGRDVIVTDYSYSDEIGNVNVKFLDGTVINASADGYATVLNAYVVANVTVNNAKLTGYNVLNMSAGGSLYVSGAATQISAASNAINIDASCKTDYMGNVESIGKFTGYIAGGIIECTGEYGNAFNLTCDEQSEVAFEIVNTVVTDDAGTTVETIVPVFLGNFYADPEGFIKGGAFKYVDWEGNYTPGASFENFADKFWPVFTAAWNGYENIYVVTENENSAIGYAEASNYLVYVATIEDGIAAVADGKTFYICKDVTVADEIVENGYTADTSINVDFGGNTVTVDKWLIPVNVNVTMGSGKLVANMAVLSNKDKLANLTLDYDMTVEGTIFNFGNLTLASNAQVDNVWVDIDDLQTADAELIMDSSEAVINGTLTVGRKNPNRNAGVPYIRMTAGNINKIQLATHDNPDIYVDPTYTYDLGVGENTITGGSIGIDTEDSVLDLMVKSGFLYTAFTTKYLVYADATAEGGEFVPAEPSVIFTDLVVGQGLAMKAYLANVPADHNYTATVNGYAVDLLLDEENGLVYAYVAISPLQVNKDFELVLKDADGVEAMYESVKFIDAANELLKGGDAQTNELIYATLNYARAFLNHYGNTSSEWTNDSYAVQAIDEVLAGTKYAGGAYNATVNGTAEVINGNYIYTITNGKTIEMKRTAVNKLNYRIYGGAGVTPNVIFNDKFDLVLDFRFANAVSDELLAGFTATIISDKDGAVAENLAIEKVVKADGTVALRVVYEDISAMDLDVNYTVVLTAPENGGTMSYTISVATYMAERMQNDASESYKDLMKAMYLYYVAAEPFGEGDIEIDNPYT